MFGILLVLFATFFTEVSDDIGKVAVARKQESIQSMAVLNMLWSFVFLILIAFFDKHFIFSLSSLPTFTIRVILEIILTQIAVIAVVRCDRSTFNFIRSATIPLLLIVDLAMGYAITGRQIIGMCIIIVTFFAMLLVHGIRTKNAGYALATAILSAATISLYKYNITHFNSVEGEQSLITLILFCYFMIASIVQGHQNPLRLLRKPIFLAQSVAAGLGTFPLSFAYQFAAASVITTAKRALSLLVGIISGRIYFHEKHFAIKIACFILILIGLIFML